MAAAAGRTPLWRALFLVSVLAILWLALRPVGEPKADWFNQADKLRHAGAFVVLWWLGQRARLGSPVQLALGLMAFGIGIELGQAFTPDHDPSVLDALADALGLLIGWRLVPRAA